MSNAQPAIMLVVRNLKSNLPFEELKRRYEERMPQFRALPGLIQKYYSRDPQTGEIAGIYFWESEEALQAYLESDLRKTIPSAYELIEAPVIERYDLVDVLRR